jgi:hypothetical protein
MPLQPSGSIRLSDVNQELGYASNAVISLNDSAVRNLFARLTGSISLTDGYSKAQTVTAVAQFTGTDLDGYKYALYGTLSAGSFTVSVGQKSIDYIVVGGGGAGGSAGGGGGGGGQVVSGTALFTGIHNVICGAGGSAINNNPITDVPTAGSPSSITPSTGGNRTITAQGGGRGGTRYSSTATTYRNGENGGGGSAYAGATGSTGPNGTTGGNGVLYYGGGGAGAGGNGGVGGVSQVLAGTGATNTVGGSSNNALNFNGWLRGGTVSQNYRLGRGGGGSGYFNSSTGYGYENSDGGFGSAGRQQPPNNNSYYYGVDGNETIGVPYTGTSTLGPSSEDFAGMGGGGGAYGTANGTVGTTWRGGGDGSQGCVLLRWR